MECHRLQHFKFLSTTLTVVGSHHSEIFWWSIFYFLFVTSPQMIHVQLKLPNRRLIICFLLLFYIVLAALYYLFDTIYDPCAGREYTRALVREYLVLIEFKACWIICEQMKSHHHHHLFWEHTFLPRWARVRRSSHMNYEVSPHIHEYCPFRMQTYLHTWFKMRKGKAREREGRGNLESWKCWKIVMRKGKDERKGT